MQANFRLGYWTRLSCSKLYEKSSYSNCTLVYYVVMYPQLFSVVTDHLSPATETRFRFESYKQFTCPQLQCGVIICEPDTLQMLYTCSVNLQINRFDLSLVPGDVCSSRRHMFFPEKYHRTNSNIVNVYEICKQYNEQKTLTNTRK